MDDTRFSPSLELAKKLVKKGAKLDIYDPYFIKRNISPYSFVKKMNFSNYELFFCVGHKEIKNLNIKFFHKKPIYFDLNNIFNNVNYKILNKKNIKFLKYQNHNEKKHFDYWGSWFYRLLFIKKNMLKSKL